MRFPGPGDDATLPQAHIDGPGYPSQGDGRPTVQRQGYLSPYTEPQVPAFIHFSDDCRFVGVIDDDRFVSNCAREICKIQTVQFAVRIEAEVFILPG